MYQEFFIGDNEKWKKFPFIKFSNALKQNFRFRFIKIIEQRYDLNLVISHSIIIECGLLGRPQADKEFELEVSSYIKGYLDAVLN